MTAITEAARQTIAEHETILLSEQDHHMFLMHSSMLQHRTRGSNPLSRPSVDVLFESAADTYGVALVAIILTGANHDGTHGLKTVIAAGGQSL